MIGFKLTGIEDTIRKRYVITIALVSGGVLLATIMFDSRGISELFVGWLSFSLRVLPHVRINWGGVGVFAVGFVLAAICLHAIAVWLSAHVVRLKRQNLAAVSQRQHPGKWWSLRSTIAVLIMFLCVFVVGISIAGVVHQTGWILNTPGGIAVGKVQSQSDARLANYDPDNSPVGVSWITACAPYVPFMLEHELVTDKPFNAPENAANFKRVLELVVCPSQGNPLFSLEGFGLSQVAANPSALGGSLAEKNSAAVMLGEVSAGFDPWGSPTNQRNLTGIRRDWNEASPGSIGYGSVHPGGANVCLVDGSVKFVSEKMDPAVMERLAQASTVNH